MYYFKVPSLKRLCLIKIATSLWNTNKLVHLEADIRGVLNGIHFTDDDCSEKDWNQIEVRVQRKISKLPIPEKSKKEISNYIKPIGEELSAWLYQNHFQFQYPKLLPGKIFWTSEGTIDKIKTARLLVADESLSVFDRYRLACIYCLEDLIDSLFCQEIEDQKIEFIHSFGCPISFLRKVNDSYTIKVRYGIEFDFEKSAVSGNFTACKYFMEKLTQNERNRLILETARQVLVKSSETKHRIMKKPYHDVLRFLFLHMDEQQRTQLSNHSLKAELWTCFLNGQWQSSCLDMSDMLSYYAFDPETYTGLLSSCVSKINEGYRDYDYLSLCRKVWDDTPSLYKIYMIGEFKKCSKRISFWQSLMETEDETTVEHVLRCASVEDKREIFLKWKRWFNFWIVDKDKWDFLKTILRVFELPKETLIAWIEHYVRFSGDNTVRVNKFIAILNEYIETSEKNLITEIVTT